MERIAELPQRELEKIPVFEAGKKLDGAYFISVNAETRTGLCVINGALVKVGGLTCTGDHVGAS